MVSKQPFKLVYDPDVTAQVRAIEPQYHSLIRHAIEQQLLFEPTVPTRNRKPLVELTHFGSAWELRFGPNNRFRVFYTVDEDRHEVQVLAIGVKRGSTLRVGGEEFKL